MLYDLAPVAWDGVLRGMPAVAAILRMYLGPRPNEEPAQDRTTRLASKWDGRRAEAELPSIGSRPDLCRR
jgi:hypothetical protein